MNVEACTPAQFTPALRRALPGDVGELTQLVNRAGGGGFEPGPRIHGLNAAELKNRLDRGIFLVAECEGSIVGTVYVETDGDVGNIGLLAVAPEHRAGNLDRRLLDVAESLCQADGCVSAQHVDL